MLLLTWKRGQWLSVRAKIIWCRISPGTPATGWQLCTNVAAAAGYEHFKFRSSSIEQWYIWTGSNEQLQQWAECGRSGRIQQYRNYWRWGSFTNAQQWCHSWQEATVAVAKAAEKQEQQAPPLLLSPTCSSSWRKEHCLVDVKVRCNDWMAARN